VGYITVLQSHLVQIRLSSLVTLHLSHLIWVNGLRPLLSTWNVSLLWALSASMHLLSTAVAYTCWRTWRLGPTWRGCSETIHVQPNVWSSISDLKWLVFLLYFFMFLFFRNNGPVVFVKDVFYLGIRKKEEIKKIKSCHSPSLSPSSALCFEVFAPPAGRFTYCLPCVVFMYVWVYISFSHCFMFYLPAPIRCSGSDPRLCLCAPCLFLSQFPGCLCCLERINNWSSSRCLTLGPFPTYLYRSMTESSQIFNSV